MNILLEIFFFLVLKINVHARAASSPDNVTYAHSIQSKGNVETLIESSNHESVKCAYASRAKIKSP